MSGSNIANEPSTQTQPEVSGKKCVPCGKKMATVAPPSAEGLPQESPANKENILTPIVSVIPNNSSVIEIVDRRTGLHAAILSRNVSVFYSCGADTTPELIGTTHNVRGGKVRLLKTTEDLAQYVPTGEKINVGVVSKVGDLKENVDILNSYGVSILIIYASDEVLTKFLQTNMEWTVVASSEMFWALVRNPDFASKEPASLRKKLTGVKDALLGYFS